MKDYANAGGPAGLWAAIRPAVVALDPMFMGDEDAFCAAYRAIGQARSIAALRSMGL